MPDYIMYQEDGYVVLESNQPEQFLSAEELLEKLKGILHNRQDNLPRELQKFVSVTQQAKHLRDNYCELDVGIGGYLQWYVVRLEK
ncbi:MAG: chlororespiratory reduction protein 7 [Moorea sp. SIO2B7]|nr:chlororespiratory reduction protein 7 [Moorena sp. SIO2B7]